MPATRLAAAYSRDLGLAWARRARAGFAADGISGKPSASLRRWRAMAIYLCGDVEPHPGPSARARVGGRDVQRRVDIRAADVNADTAAKYEEMFGESEVHLRHRGRDPGGIMREEGTHGLITAAADFLHLEYKEHRLSSSAAGTFCSAVRRYLHLAESSGFVLGCDLKSAMRPLWRVQKSWETLVPPEFRCPVPAHAAAAIAMVCFSQGWFKLGVLTLISFHCLLRPDEARHVRYCDMSFIEPELVERDPGVYAILRVAKPKTRRIHSAAAVQHVVIQDGNLARFPRRFWDDIPPARLSDVIWSAPATAHGYRFKQAVQMISPKVGWTLAGLRGGGATDF